MEISMPHVVSYTIAALFLITSCGQALSEDGAVDGQDLQIWEQSHGPSNGTAGASSYNKTARPNALAGKPIKKGIGLLNPRPQAHQELQVRRKKPAQ
jgi:hypothetical protein